MFGGSGCGDREEWFRDVGLGFWCLGGSGVSGPGFTVSCLLRFRPDVSAACFGWTASGFNPLGPQILGGFSHMGSLRVRHGCRFDSLTKPYKLQNRNPYPINPRPRTPLALDARITQNPKRPRKNLVEQFETPLTEA